MNGQCDLAQTIKVCPTPYLRSKFPKVRTTGTVNDDLLPSDDWLLARNKPLPHCYKTV